MTETGVGQNAGQLSTSIKEADVENMKDMKARGRTRSGSVKGERNNKGERHGCAKLGNKDVQEIRRRYANQEVTQDELSTEFGVARATIWRVIHRVN